VSDRGTPADRHTFSLPCTNPSRAGSGQERHGWRRGRCGPAPEHSGRQQGAPGGRWRCRAPGGGALRVHCGRGLTVCRPAGAALTRWLQGLVLHATVRRGARPPERAAARRDPLLCLPGAGVPPLFERVAHRGRRGRGVPGRLRPPVLQRGLRGQGAAVVSRVHVLVLCGRLASWHQVEGTVRRPRSSMWREPERPPAGTLTDPCERITGI